jgi:hypothetical protein
MIYYSSKFEYFHSFTLQFLASWIKIFNRNGLAEVDLSFGHLVLLTVTT